MGVCSAAAGVIGRYVRRPLHRLLAGTQLPIDADLAALCALPERALGRIEGYIVAQIKAGTATQARPRLLAASGP